MDENKYHEAVKVSALDKDIDSFDYGDLTEIGQRGLNMSGGQKQRIQLARAVYSDADIYILDDPFSAVDAHTAATLFNVRLTVKTCYHACENLPIKETTAFYCLDIIAGLCYDCSEEQNSYSCYSSSGVPL